MSEDYTGPDTVEAQIERRRAAAGELPERYGTPWAAEFHAEARKAFAPGIAILDLGSGRDPIIPPEERPAGATYVGLDISASELAAAAAGSYEEIVVADVSDRVAELEGRFDLIVSWQVLEHVPDMAVALENARSYLRPGGRFVALVSGGLALYSVLARVIPYPVAEFAMRKLLGVEEGQKFPTRYDNCTARALHRLLATWSEHRIEARYKAAAYFGFSRRLERAYLVYENWAARSGRDQLATHYLIVASR